MPTLQVRTEFLPARCEICHQTDCFNPTANYCSRCASVSATDYQRLPTLNTTKKSPTITDVELGASFGLLTGILAGTIGGAVTAGTAGAIIGFLGFPAIWVIQGAINGLLMGQETKLTDNAAIEAISKAIPISGSVPTLKPTSRNLIRPAKGAVVGAMVSMVGWLFAMTSWGWNEIAAFPLAFNLWVVLGTLNGVLTDILCRSRSDRRHNPSYPPASHGRDAG